MAGRIMMQCTKGRKSGCASDEERLPRSGRRIRTGFASLHQVHPQSGLPWSSKALRECYQQGAERFNWSRRTPNPRSKRDGRWLVGYGMAAVHYVWYQPPCQARVSLFRDGRVYVRSAATDIGTGMYTVMTQLSAEFLGLPLDQIRFGLGDQEYLSQHNSARTTSFILGLTP